MNKYALEVKHIGGDKMLDLVNKEFTNSFFIIARTQDYIILGDGKKNVSFCRLKNEVLARTVHEQSFKLGRKR